MIRPNLFQYAKKELSQDAMVCWLLACLHSEDAEYKKIGLDFIRLIFEDEFLREEDVELEQDSPRNQYFHMDVYATVRIKDKLYPVIFENKTNTYLHSNQLENYCTQVSSWMDDKYLNTIANTMSVQQLSWGNIKFVFFKTGYVFYWQEIDLKKQVEKLPKDVKEKVLLKKIDIDVIIDFLQKHHKDAMLKDYLDVLTDRKKQFDFAKENGLVDMAHCYECLENLQGSNEVIIDRIFEECFGSNIDIGDIKYSHQQWATINLFTTHSTTKDWISYGFRFERSSYDYEKGKKVYTFLFYQYRKEKDAPKNVIDSQARIEEARSVKEICNKIITEIVGARIKFKNIRTDINKSCDDKKLWGAYLYGDNITPKEICDFIRTFTQIICKRIKEHPDFIDVKINENLCNAIREIEAEK